MLEETKAEIGTVFGGLVKEEAGKLEDKRALDCKQMLDEKGRLVGGQGVEENAEDAGQQSLRMIGVRSHLDNQLQSVQDNHGSLGG